MNTLAFTREETPVGGIAGELRALLKLAVPIGATQAGIALMGLVDTAVVGRVGPGPLGAVGLGNGIFFGIAIVGIGLMMGLDPLISQAVGAGHLDRARLLLVQSGWLALFATLILSVPIAIAPALLGPLGSPPEVIADARNFILCRLPGLLPMLLFTGTRAYLQGLGLTRALVVSTVIANVANLGLDVLFVFGGGPVPALGAAGAGLSTSLCSALQFGVLAFFAREKQVKFAGVRPSLKPDWMELRQALRIGTPIGLQLGAEVGVFSIAGVLAGNLGEMALAAHQVALSLASFTFCFALGVGGAGSVRVGWAVGANDRPAMRRRGFVAIAAGAGVMSIFGLVLFFFPAACASIVSNSPEVLAVAAPLLAVAALFQVADGTQAVGAGVLRGAADTRFSFLANLFGHYCVGLPVSILCGFVFQRGILGIWWGLSCGLFTVAIALFLRFNHLSRRSAKVVAASTYPA